MNIILQSGMLSWIFFASSMQLFLCLVLYTFSIQDPTGTMFNFSETQEFHDFLALMREFNELGIWRMDALTNPNSMVDNFMAGRSGSAINTTVANAWQEVMAHFPEWEPEVIDATFGTATVVNSFISNGFGIRAISQHPERFGWFACSLVLFQPPVNKLAKRM